MAALGWLFGGLAAAQESPRLGVPATPEQIAAWDISIGPDGVGLPPGQGSVAAGKALYEQKCLACHGVAGAGQPNDRLAGGHGTLKSAAPVRTIGSFWPYATTLFDYIRRAMPFFEPLSLSNDDVYALTAYLLYLNDVIDADAVVNAATLPKIEMPNRDNFVSAFETDR
jgi:cytochrome c